MENIVNSLILLGEECTGRPKGRMPNSDEEFFLVHVAPDLHPNEREEVTKIILE